MKDEEVFSIGGEGGGISISREVSDAGVAFIYHHSEFDPTGEGLAVKKHDVYTTFEEPFQRINSRYPWYALYIITIHDDYKAYIIESLMEKLNKDSVSPEALDHCRYSLEKELDIEIVLSTNKENKPCWTCVKK